MKVWLWNAILIEMMALAGFLGVRRTRRTHVAFAIGFNTMLPVAGLYILAFPPLTVRHIILLVMVLLYLAHMNWLLLFQSRHTAIPKLDAGISAFQKSLLPVVLTNTVGWGYCLPFYFAARKHTPLGWQDGIAVLVYAIGTLIHFGSDFQKKRFKARADSEGKLLQTGFWALCRHPNYFGDFLIYLSFAWIGGSVWGWVAPVLNFVQYRMDAIPKNERWAAARYGPRWEAYKKRVKMFIPFLY